MTQPSPWIFLLIVLNTLVVLHSIQLWIDEPRFPFHKIPDNAIDPRRAVVRLKIMLYHNNFLARVSPMAAHMLAITWHAGAARQAQEYAEHCVFLKHNYIVDRIVPHLGACGQNIFAAADKTPWFFVIKNWFLEYQNFTYPYHGVLGYYTQTQTVFATTHKVGCGVSLCPGGPWGQFYNYVCHYCPGDNIEGLVEYPDHVGKPCGDCPHNCVSGLSTNSCPAKDRGTGWAI